MTAGVVSDNMQWRSLNAPFNEQGNSLVLRDIETLFLGLQQVQAALGVNTTGAPTSVSASLLPPAALPTGSTPSIPNPLPVAQGGTGVQTITGYAKGAGTAPFTGVPLIPRADLANGVARSVIGRAAAGTGAVADIGPATLDTILGYNPISTSVAFFALSQFLRWSSNFNASSISSVGAGSGTLVNGSSFQFCVVHGVGGGAGTDPTIATAVLGYISSAAGVATNRALNQDTFKNGGGGGGGFVAIFQVNGGNLDYVVGSKGAGGVGPTAGGATSVNMSGASAACIAGGGTVSGSLPSSASIGSFYSSSAGKLLLFIPLQSTMPDPPQEVVYTSGLSFTPKGRGGLAPCLFGTTAYGRGGNCDGGTGDGVDGRLFYDFY